MLDGRTHPAPTGDSGSTDPVSYPLPMRHVDELVDVVGTSRTDGIVVEPGDAFDRSEGVGLLVTLAVAVLEDTRPEQLSPLYGSVDPTVLDSLVVGAADDAGLAVRFVYEGYDVTLRPAPRVELSPTQ